MAKEQSGKEISRPESVRLERMPRTMSPFEEMDRMFESFFPQFWSRPLRRLWGEGAEGLFPRVDVIDRDNEVLIRAEVPGVTKESLDISVTDSTITIRGSTQISEAEEMGEYYRSEIARGIFSRSIALPAEVDADHASTSFNNGLLELKLPKIEKSKRHSIKVS